MVGGAVVLVAFSNRALFGQNVLFGLYFSFLRTRSKPVRTYFVLCLSLGLEIDFLKGNIHGS